jgi:hypothetical protein
MDLLVRKYHFIEELLRVEKEGVLDKLEKVLKKEKEFQDDIPDSHKKELDKRLESYRHNPDDVLDWEEVKSKW